MAVRKSSNPTVAREYDMKYPQNGEWPSIDGERLPWKMSACGPMVEPLDDGGAFHILWLPILVDGPMPSPPVGKPEGVHLNDSDVAAEVARRAQWSAR